MSDKTVAGIDWAGEKWLAIVLVDGVPVQYPCKEYSRQFGTQTGTLTES